MPKLMLNSRKLRELRIDLRWTQQDLADASGLGRPDISRLETGARSNVLTGTVHALATALGVTIDELLLKPLSIHEPETAYDVAKRKVSVQLGDFTEDELSEVLRYIQFLKSQRQESPKHSQSDLS